MDRGAGLDAARLVDGVEDIRITAKSIDENGVRHYGGEPAGYVIRMPGGFAVYHAGDTALFGDMKLIGELYKPDAAMLPIGDLFTMGPREAAKLDAVIESLRIDVERLASDEAITIIRETLHAYREPRQAEARAAHRRRILAYEAGAATRRSQLGQSQSVSSVSSGRCSSAAVPPGRSAGHGLSPAGFAAFHSC